jgi:hypothetical protein
MALIPPFFLDTVVAIGVGDDPNIRRWIGTGFIFGFFNKALPDTNQKYYHLWLITNKHVLKDLNDVYIKFNSAQEPQSKDYKVHLKARNGRVLWTGHPVEFIDVAAFGLSASVLNTDEMQYSFFRSDENILNREKMRANGVTEGDRVFVLGFPMGLVEPDRQYVICRGGCIARVRDFIEWRTTEFLIDAPVFPGNSGGPVIICPSPIAIQGTNAIMKADLIGMVKAYVPYTDIAISAQTLHQRILFEENSGLAAVESVDSIIETVELAEKRLSAWMAQENKKN